MRARQITVRVFTLFLVLSAAYLAVWHRMPAYLLATNEPFAPPSPSPGGLFSCP